MKKILFTLAAFAVTTIAVAQKKVADVATFKSETIDFGKIKVNNPPTAVFQITNIGSEPLIIESANPTCGCTIGDYTKSPIAPGKQGEVKATYNAASIGAFTKTMTVKFAGVDELKSITIKGEVLSEEDYAKLKPAVLNTAGSKDTKPSGTVAKQKLKAKH
jgi:DNA-binding protein YbaB